jgi:ABC-type uncharacterized transport system permease subunit
LGRLVQGFAVLALATSLVPIDWDAAAVATAVWAVAGGVALFSGILVLQASLAFWTVESLEVANVLTYGGVQAAQYPLNIYAAWFRHLLTFARADRRLCLSWPVFPRLARRHGPLCVHGELTESISVHFRPFMTIFSISCAVHLF